MVDRVSRTNSPAVLFVGCLLFMHGAISGSNNNNKNVDVTQRLLRKIEALHDDVSGMSIRMYAMQKQLQSLSEERERMKKEWKEMRHSTYSTYKNVVFLNEVARKQLGLTGCYDNTSYPAHFALNTADAQRLRLLTMKWAREVGITMAHEQHICMSQLMSQSSQTLQPYYDETGQLVVPYSQAQLQPAQPVYQHQELPQMQMPAQAGSQQMYNVHSQTAAPEA